MQTFPVSTGVFIRQYLLEHKEGSIWDMYTAFKQKKKHLTTWKNHPAKTGSYQNLRNYVFWLRKLGLIEFSREEPSRIPKLQPRHYYRLTRKGKDKPQLFSNPRRDLYPKSWKRSH